MKKGSLVLLTVIVFSYLFTGVLFAQTLPEIVVAGRANAQSVTPTPKTAQPTTNPTPTLTQPSPTSQVTAAPSPQADPTSIPEQALQNQTVGPTTTPTPLPPTPTPKPKPIVVAAIKPPIQPPINQIITAPFALVMNSLPQSYYNDEGLAPQTNKVLLLLAFLCLLSGTILLNWPALVRSARRMFAPRVKERDVIPYLPGRALTK